MIISIKKNWASIEVRHNNFVLKKIDDYLARTQHQGPKSLTAHFVEKTKTLIISNDFRDLALAARYYDFVIKKNSNNKDLIKVFKKNLIEIFDYHNFTTKTKGYDAYDLCSASKARSCPYCNQSYAFTVRSQKKGFRPTLDHFFPQGSYPHLALSLYNLVPACSICNSSLKGQINFYKKPHLHPLFDDESIEFSLETTKSRNEIVALLDVNIKEFKVKITHKNDIRTINSIKTFIIEKRYESFIFEAVNFARCKIYYDELKNNNQINIVRDINENAALMFNHHAYQNQLLGKLFKGIYQQYSSPTKL
ncbi:MULTISPECIES: hypothetical protein [Yersiniaceae]|uniref:hypothetical protein n=1 Tax=Yersiniaceae TaxID=1903411 RepID=UPI001047864A|nr:MULTISPECIES: hypothetical protein [Yersiniaceae]TCQ93879.1 hypothetical protein EC840_101942 [Rahnella sp. JUb53]